MTSPHAVASHFEGLAAGFAGAMANAMADGRARAEARAHEAAAARAEAETLAGVATVARAMTTDRLTLRRLHAENVALKAQLAAQMARAARAEEALIRVRR